MPIEILVPQLAESVSEATVGKWAKREGDSVNVGDVVAELETDKVNVEVSADAPGVLESIAAPEGAVVHPGEVLGVISDGVASTGSSGKSETAAPASLPASSGKAEAQPASGNGGPGAAGAEAEDVRASPLAERVAKDLNVDISRVPATGPGQRVTREDVEAYAARGEGGEPRGEVGKSSAPAVAPAPAPAAAGVADGRQEVRQRLTRRRLTIARRLVEAQQTAAMLTTFNEVDMSAVIALRTRWKDKFKEQYGVGLGFMSFFTKATIGALKAFPQVNSELRGEELVIKKYYDIGIAIGDAEGLVVPVVRNADKMSFAEIEQAIAGFVKKSQERALTIDDLRGGTFTITNGGVFGSLLSTPILNPPQVGILGMHKIQPRPVALNGEVVLRPMMYTALTYDHRVVDGREAVQFLVRVKELIEDPERLLFDA